MFIKCFQFNGTSKWFSFFFLKDEKVHNVLGHHLKAFGGAVAVDNLGKCI